MGLMLSILITCVGVAELLAFYTNVRRRLVMPLHPTLPPPHPRLQQHEREMGDVTQNYMKELNRERNRLLNEIRRLEGERRRKSASPTSDSTHFKSLTDTKSYAQNISLNSHAIQTPQNATDISTASFGKAAEEFQEDDTQPRPFVDRHVGHMFPSYTDGGNKTSPSLSKPYEETPQIVLTDSAYESSPSLQQDSYEHLEHREREASPFPTYESIAPRGSICSELIVNPTVSVDEADEEGYRSHSPNPSQKQDKKKDEFLKSQFNSKDYWKHKSKSRSRTPEILRENLLDFERKSRSRSASPLVLQHSQTPQEECNPTAGELVDSRFWTRSPSPFQKILDIYKSTAAESIDAEPSGVSITELPSDYKEVGVEKEVLEMVDGKLTPLEQHKRMFKNKKQRKNKKSSNEQELHLEQQRTERQADYGTYGSSSTVIGVDENAIDANKFKKVDMDDVQDAGPSSSKQGEPFWVKKT